MGCSSHTHSRDWPGGGGSQNGSLRRALRLLAVLFMFFGALGAPLLSATAAHADDKEVSVFGTLKDGDNNDAPIPDVKITITDPAGATQEIVSDEDGRFRVKVPVSEEATNPEITVEFDESTFPDGVSLRDPDANPQVRKVGQVSSVPINLPFGADNREVKGVSDRIPQLVYNGLYFGVVLALGALGLSMIFGTTGLTNFAHGEMLTLGALAAFLVNNIFNMPFAVATVAAVLAGGLFGWLQDKALWAPLRKRGTGLIAMMIVSIGLMFFLRNLIQFLTKSRQENYREFYTPESKQFLGIDYTIRDLVVLAVSIVAIAVVSLWLSRTRLGRATRAVADNPALASSSGINVGQVIRTVWMLGGALAALGGCFMAFQLGVTFNIGQLTLLLLFASVTVGGLGSTNGAIVGSIIIGLLIELSTLVIPTELKNAGALVLLAVILLVRPQGLLGRKERIG